MRSWKKLVCILGVLGVVMSANLYIVQDLVSANDEKVAFQFSDDDILPKEDRDFIFIS